jgi:acyl-CoA synthetase (NDP forming)
VPPAVDHPATVNADTRDVALAIAARATNAQLKRPFCALSQRNNPVDVTSYLAAMKETMADLHDDDWIDDVYLHITNPDAQGNSESVNDVINRQKDLVTAYSWVLFVIDQPVPADLQNKAGRGSLNALPSYEDKIHAATAHMLSSTRSDFRNIERIAKNFSRDLNGQSRKRKTEVLTSE